MKVNVKVNWIFIVIPLKQICLNELGNLAMLTDLDVATKYCFKKQIKFILS